MLQTYEAPVVSHGAPSARVSPRKPRLEPPIIINSRKYWRQSTTDAFKAALQAYALGIKSAAAPRCAARRPAQAHESGRARVRRHYQDNRSLGRRGARYRRRMTHMENPAPLAAADRASENVSFATERAGHRPARERLQAAPPGLPRQRDFNAEARVQAAAIEWIRVAAPQVVAFHPANGGWRSPREAARFKWLGVPPRHPRYRRYRARWPRFFHRDEGSWRRSIAGPAACPRNSDRRRDAAGDLPLD